MGRFRTAFDAVLYSLAIMIVLFAAGLFSGMMPRVSGLFGVAGFVALAFLIYTLIVK